MMRRWTRYLLFLVVMLAMGSFAAYRYWCQITRPVQSGAHALIAPTLYIVQPGTSARRIAEDLEKQGIVRSAYALRILARWQQVSHRLQAGEYELSATMRPEEILHKIVEGQVKLYSVTIAEGLTLQEIASVLETTGLVSVSEFLAYARSARAVQECGVEGKNLEGYLFPETYSFARGVSAQQIATALTREFHKNWKKISAEATQSRFSMLEIVTLASIIEKETGSPNERPLIASVFLNRLGFGMRLQSDPTVIYGIANFDGNLRRRQLDDATNPYNTYQIRGLPPGPIANPGAEALRAVLHPAQTKYLYFVARNDGSHYFSETYREHVNAVNLFQRNQHTKESPSTQTTNRKKRP